MSRIQSTSDGVEPLTNLQKAIMHVPWMRHHYKKKKLVVTLYHPFHPPESTERIDHLLRFQKLTQLIANRRIEIERIEIREKSKQLNAEIKAMKIIGEIFAGKRKAGKRTRKMLVLTGLSESELGKLLERIVISGGNSESHPKQTISSDSINEIEASIKRSKIEIQQSINTLPVYDVIDSLVASGFKNNSHAAIELAKIANHATLQLYAICGMHPKLLLEYSRLQPGWPVIATRNPRWTVSAQEFIDKLELGSATLLGKLKPKLSYDKSVPGRAWARVAIETIEVNRERFANFEALKGGLIFLEQDHKLELVQVPSWAYKTGGLKPLSRDTIKDWVKLAREMIHHECRDLHLLPEWRGVVTRYRHLRTNRGVVRNKILDAIASSMKTLVAESCSNACP